jgi:hypothetical protein
VTDDVIGPEPERTLCTREEAVRLIKRAPPKTTFCVHVSRDAPIADKSESVFPLGLFTYLRITRKDALRMARDCVSDALEARGARIPMARCANKHAPPTIWLF